MATSTLTVKPVLEDSLLQSAFQISANGSTVHRSDSETSTEVPDSHAGDTFRAFTETVEALALQKSVIGSVGIAPASMEEIEKAIAEAQAKMKLKSLKEMDNSVESSTGTSATTEGNATICELPSVVGHLKSSSGKSSLVENVGSHRSSVNDSSMLEVDPNAKLVTSVEAYLPSSVADDRKVVHADGTQVLSPILSNAIVSSGLPDSCESSKGPQLIRASAERVITAAQPRGSWFWSSSKSPEAGENVKKSATTVSKKGSKRSKKSNGAKLEADEFVEQQTSTDTFGVVEEVNLSSDASKSAVHGAANGGFVLNATKIGIPVAEDKTNQDNLVSSSEQFTSPVKDLPLTQVYEVRSNAAKADNLLAEKLTHSEIPNSPNSKILKHPDLQLLRSGGDASPDGKKSRRTSIPTISQQSSVAEDKQDDSLLERVLREKAGLEGRLEMLEQENREMLREQVELKARVAAAEEQMKASSATGQGLTMDRKALVADVETLRQNRARLEAVIMDAHKLLEEKDQEVKTLERDVELARQAGEKHLERVADGKRQLGNRDSTIKDLKAKIAQLFVETQTSDQSRKITEGELVAIKADIAALTEAKEWYASQLKAAQKDRNRLQAEAASAKAETISASVAAERLRAENARMKRNLTEVEQRVLMEKQKLAHHLEDIEHDMMEREAAFSAQLGQAVELADRHLASSSNAIEGSRTDELDMLRGELGRIRELTEITRHESSDLSRRLALAQQCIVERDETIKLLEHDRETAEVRAESAEHDAALHLETVRQMENERTELQAQLVASSEEKRVIDESLQSLKRNTLLLESSFRKMQQDLIAKSAEVDKIKSSSVAEAHSGLSKVSLDLDSGLPQLLKNETEKTDGLVKSESVNFLAAESKKVSVEIQTDRVELQTSSADTVDSVSGVLSTDTADVSIYHQPESISLVEYGVSETSTVAVDSSELEAARTEIRRLQLEYAEQHRMVDELQSLLAGSQLDLDVYKSQISSLSEELRLMVSHRLEAESRGDTAAERVRDLEVQLQNVIDERSQLERLRDENDRNSLAVHSSATSTVSTVDESGELRLKIVEMHRDSQKEVAKLKAKILKLNKQLEASTAEQGKLVIDYEVQIRELGQQLTLANDSALKLSSQIDEVRRQSSMDSDERIARLQEDLNKTTAELETSVASRHELEMALQQAKLEHGRSVDEQYQRCGELDAELQSLRIALEERQAADERAVDLALELEKERGRLAGLSQSHTALKEHAQLLEATLADRVSTDVRTDSALRDEIDKREHTLTEAKSQIQQLESELVKERQNVKDIRTQLLTEKGGHVKTRRVLEQLTAEHGQLLADSSEMRENYAKLTSDSDSFVEQELEHKMAAERIAAEMKVTMVERDRLLRELEDQKNRDAALLDNIQGLEWRLSEKDNDIAAAHQRFKLIEDRQNTELTSVSQTLQLTISELSSVREELASVKKEKSSIQMKMIPLQAALKKALLTKVDLSVATETTAELERLLQDSAPAAVDSKPLSFLQATLSGLRGEISSLQMQITEHTSAVQSSSVAWRELEAQVQDLREVCQTSAADRAASAAYRPPVLPSVKLPPSLTPRSATLPLTSGPVVVPSNLVNVMVPQPRYDSSSSSSSPSPDRNFASDSRRSSKSSAESDVLSTNGGVRQ